MPLITVQAVGVVYMVRSRRAETSDVAEFFGDDEIIELWEVA